MWQSPHAKSFSGDEMSRPPLAIPTDKHAAFFRSPAGAAVLACGWFAVVIFGGLAMSRHAGAAGPVVQTAKVWPVGDRLPRAHGIATLVMAVHPECPCTRASVNDLEMLMTRCQGRLHTIVLFVEPAGLKADTAAAELWQSAARIEGVTCLHDCNGDLAARFGAGTSGQVFVYDTDGVLQFSGGITASRGHAGDTDGANAIEAIANHEEPATRQAPVFGCSLH
jgi:hypothetical protein